MNTHSIDHQQEFFVHLEDGQRAYVRYRFIDSKSARQSVDFYSTYVPKDHRGKGLAAALVEQGFNWAEQLEFEILTSCWYAQKKFQAR
jgi:predicted GNAT family acetyltransferase